jgi:hypothetical protein
MQNDFHDHRSGSPTTAVSTAVFIGTASGGQVVANANAARNALTIFNAGATTMYVRYGAPAIATAGMPILANTSLYEPDFTGTVSLIAPSATGMAYVMDVGA